MYLSIPFRILLIQMKAESSDTLDYFQFLLGFFNGKDIIDGISQQIYFQFLLGFFKYGLIIERKIGYELSIPFRILRTSENTDPWKNT